MLPEDLDLDDDPLEVGPKQQSSFPSVPSEMINSIALGQEEDVIVAARHGYSLESYKELEKQKWFQLQVNIKRSEFESKGITFKTKAAMRAEDLMDDIYVLAKNPKAPLAQKLDAFKTFSKLGGLEPKEEKDKQLVNLPTIIINGGTVSLGGPSEPPPLTIDMDNDD